MQENNIYKKAREMFDEKFVYQNTKFDFPIVACSPDSEEPSKNHFWNAYVIHNFIDQIIDLAIAERDRNIVEMIEKKIDPRTQGHYGEIGAGYIQCGEDIINFITNSKK